MPTLQVCNTSEEMKDFAFEYPRSRTSLFYNLKKRANNQQEQSEYVDPLLQEKHVEDFYCSDTEDETITSGSSSVSGSSNSSPTTPTPPSLLIMNQLEDNLSLLTNAMHNHHQKAAARVEPIYLMEESSERDLQWAMDRCYDPLNLVPLQREEEQQEQGFTTAATVTTVNKKSETENAAATHRPLHHHPSHRRFDPIQNMESQLRNLKKGVRGVAHLFLYDGVQAPLASKKENQQETSVPPKNNRMSSKEPWPCGDAYLSNPSVQAQILQDIQLANQQKQHDRSSSNNKSFSILVATTTIEDDDFELDVDQDGNVSVWC